MCLEGRLSYCWAFLLTDEETVRGDGVFRGKTFILLGFSEEDVGDLTELVELEVSQE